MKQGNSSTQVNWPMTRIETFFRMIETIFLGNSCKLSPYEMRSISGAVWNLNVIRIVH